MAHPTTSRKHHTPPQNGYAHINSAVLSARFSPADDDVHSLINFEYDFANGACEYAGRVAGTGGEIVRSNVDRFTILVDPPLRHSLRILRDRGNQRPW